MAKLLKIREAAEALGGCVSTTTLWRQCQAGEIPAVRIGSRWLIPALLPESASTENDNTAGL